MAFPRTPGHPDYTAGGSSKFIPEVWSGKLQVKLYDATVLSVITNTDYEGEIRDQGDKVYIRTVPDVTIKDYAKGQKLAYERLESPDVELLIDKGKYWAFTVDDVDKWQSDIALLDRWSDDASMQLKKSVDSDVLQNIVSDTELSSDNYGTTAGRISNSFNLGTSGAPVQVTKTNILEYLVDCGTVLDEQNVPETGRFFIIPAWMAGLIKKSDIKDASLSGDNTSIMRNGRIGQIDRFTLYLSNLVYTTTDGVAVWYCLFGHKMATTFATQITKTESLRAESTFGDLVRGLMVYGYKVVKGEALGYLYVRK